MRHSEFILGELKAQCVRQLLDPGSNKIPKGITIGYFQISIEKYMVLNIYRSGNIPQKCPSQKSGFWTDLKNYGTTNLPTVPLVYFLLWKCLYTKALATSLDGSQNFEGL